jgi:hypothetical protein
VYLNLLYISKYTRKYQTRFKMLAQTLQNIIKIIKFFLKNIFYILMLNYFTGIEGKGIEFQKQEFKLSSHVRFHLCDFAIKLETCQFFTK